MPCRIWLYPLLCPSRIWLYPLLYLSRIWLYPLSCPSRIWMYSLLRPSRIWFHPLSRPSRIIKLWDLRDAEQPIAVQHSKMSSNTESISGKPSESKSGKLEPKPDKQSYCRNGAMYTCALWPLNDHKFCVGSDECYSWVIDEYLPDILQILAKFLPITWQTLTDACAFHFSQIPLGFSIIVAFRLRILRFCLNVPDWRAIARCWFVSMAESSRENRWPFIMGRRGSVWKTFAAVLSLAQATDNII